MPYILERAEEFGRLERQSQLPQYDYHAELDRLRLPTHARVLDAGCGSGVVSRYLAQSYPQAQITGCDVSEDRLVSAVAAAIDFSNLRFVKEDLLRMSFAAGAFDHVLCRFVLEHLTAESMTRACSEFFRVLSPGGAATVIDIDGLLVNLHPQPAEIAEVVARLSAKGPVDFTVGRKIPSLLTGAGFTDISWRIETAEIKGEMLAQESEMMRERFEAAMPFLKTFLGTETKAVAFTKGYLEAMQAPDAVLFYNKFIVNAVKSLVAPKRLTLVG